MTLLPCHWSPRCGAKTRSGKKCRNGAMPNGRCKHHGGKAPSGRANGAFRTGKFTKQAIAERADAKAMRRAAHAEYLDAVEPYLRFGAKNAFEVKAARRRYDEKMARAAKAASPRRRRPSAPRDAPRSSVGVRITVREQRPALALVAPTRRLIDQIAVGIDRVKAIHPSPIKLPRTLLKLRLKELEK